MRPLIALVLCLALPAHAEGFLTRLLNHPVPGGVAVVELGTGATAPSARFQGKPVLVVKEDQARWIAIVGPARMPPELVSRVNAVLVAALSNPQVHDTIAKGAYETAPSTPAELATEIRSAYERWGAMIKQIGFVKQ